MFTNFTNTKINLKNNKDSYSCPKHHDKADNYNYNYILEIFISVWLL